jgi:hypothetical protein
MSEALLHSILDKHFSALGIADVRRPPARSPDPPAPSARVSPPRRPAASFLADAKAALLPSRLDLTQRLKRGPRSFALTPQYDRRP